MQTLIEMTNKEEQFIEAVLLKLEIIGIELSERDNNLLAFNIKKAENYIKNFCNISEIPKGLFFVEVDLACGMFLKEKFYNEMEIDEKRIKSIQEGDTSVIYEYGESKSKKIQGIINSLLDKNEELLCYRKIKWQ